MISHPCHHLRPLFESLNAGRSSSHDLYELSNLTFPKKNHTNINKKHLEAVHLKIPALREIPYFRMGVSNVFTTKAQACRKNRESLAWCRHA